MIIKLTDINCKKLQEYELDILLNKNLTNISSSNMYEILFDCENFNEIFNLVLDEIKKTKNDDFSVYVKNMWGYIQNSSEPNGINFDINFKNQITIPSEYSFIYLIKSNVTSIFLKKDDVIQNIILNEGELVIFKTNAFLKDNYFYKDRIALIGSISKVVENINPIKKVII